MPWAARFTNIKEVNNDLRFVSLEVEYFNSDNEEKFFETLQHDIENDLEILKEIIIAKIDFKNKILRIKREELFKEIKRDKNKKAVKFMFTVDEPVQK